MEKEIKILVGKRIKELRIIKKELNQEELAEIIGCDRTYISKIESGKQNITLENLNDICNALDVSLSEFFKNFTYKIDYKELNEEEGDGE